MRRLLHLITGNLLMIYLKVSRLLNGHPNCRRIRADLRLSTDAIIHDFAQDVPVKEARLIAATQGSWFSGCTDEKVDHAAWHEKPSSFVVTEKDQMINPGLQETMANNIKATVIKANASHMVMVSQPEKTASAIIEAVDSLK